MSHAVRLSTVRGPFCSAFTNGILLAQWLANVLDEDGTISRNTFAVHLGTDGVPKTVLTAPACRLRPAQAEHRAGGPHR